jgi:predicted nucleic acid-binding protein
MKVFADTSALFALLVSDDSMHVRAKLNFEYFARNNIQLLTSSYVLLETLTLLQRRVGMDAANDFDLKIVPILEIVWVDAAWHKLAMQRLQMEKSRHVSLTDCLSFEIMERRDIACAFTFDKHFRERGFETASFHDVNEAE